MDLNHIDVNDLAGTLLERLPDDVRVPFEDGGINNVNPEYADALADLLQRFIADVIAGILNAGSERDAVNESMPLSAALLTEITSWTPDPA